MSVTKRLYMDDPYLYEENPYKADIDWNIYMAQTAAILKARQEAANNIDDEDVGYHGLRMSDL